MFALAIEMRHIYIFIVIKKHISFDFIFYADYVKNQNRLDSLIRLIPITTLVIVTKKIVGVIFLVMFQCTLRKFIIGIIVF